MNGIFRINNLSYIEVMGKYLLDQTLLDSFLNNSKSALKY